MINKEKLEEEIVIKEISNNVFYQYPDKVNNWNKLLRGRFTSVEFEKMIETYEDFLSTFNFMLNLIKSLSKKKK